MGKKFFGCSEDCLNCRYPDCLKPVCKMDLKSPLERVDRINKRKTDGSSLVGSFSLELGSAYGNAVKITGKYW